jgi:hypothetical protein
MAPLRSLVVLLILIGLYFAATAVAQAPVEWYSGGGVAAGPPSNYSGGGALAPSLGTETVPAPPTPNLPSPTEQPKSDDSPPAEAARAARPAAATAAHAARAPAARAAAAPASLPSDDSLPFTGFELAAVVAAGLCLLLTGFALRPARR